jgi:hypothetical protein
MAMSDDQVLKQLRDLRAGGLPAAGGRRPSPRPGATTGGAPRRSDAEVARAVLALELALSSPSFQGVLGGGAKAAAATAAATSGSSFCDIYGEIKGYIDIVVEALDWLPVPYASTIIKVLRLLEQFADQACRPQPGSAAKRAAPSR